MKKFASLAAILALCTGVAAAQMSPVPATSMKPAMKGSSMKGSMKSPMPKSTMKGSMSKGSMTKSKTMASPMPKAT